MPTMQFSTFTVADHLFGIEVLRVQEVIRHLEMTPVPLASRDISGLINLRGQIVTAIDLREKLDMPQRTDGKLPMNVVVRSEESSVSLLVDAIGDVIEVDQDAFERPPETMEGVARHLIRGAYKLDGRLLLVLDIERVLAVATPA
ncbi:MAG: chemotaxis protein CheW [Actinomycetota bacterium]|nr:chemotaxis protein CheW [Actinomycetota bacterium]